jgi:hypothetical protein
VIFLLHTYGVLTLRDSWPLFIVATGASMLVSRSQGGACAGKATSPDARSLRRP